MLATRYARRCHAMHQRSHRAWPSRLKIDARFLACAFFGALTRTQYHICKGELARGVNRCRDRDKCSQRWVCQRLESALRVFLDAGRLSVTSWGPTHRRRGGMWCEYSRTLFGSEVILTDSKFPASPPQGKELPTAVALRTRSAEAKLPMREIHRSETPAAFQYTLVPPAKGHVSVNEVWSR